MQINRESMFERGLFFLGYGATTMAFFLTDFAGIFSFVEFHLLSAGKCQSQFLCSSG
jgi:hypothetical protein